MAAARSGRRVRSSAVLSRQTPAQPRRRRRRTPPPSPAERANRRPSQDCRLPRARRRTRRRLDPLGQGLPLARGRALGGRRRLRIWSLRRWQGVVGALRRRRWGQRQGAFHCERQDYRRLVAGEAHLDGVLARGGQDEGKRHGHGNQEGLVGLGILRDHVASHVQPSYLLLSHTQPERHLILRELLVLVNYADHGQRQPEGTQPREPQRAAAEPRSCPGRTV